MNLLYLKIRKYDVKHHSFSLHFIVFFLKFLSYFQQSGIWTQLFLRDLVRREFIKHLPWELKMQMQSNIAKFLGWELSLMGSHNGGLIWHRWSMGGCWRGLWNWFITKQFNDKMVLNFGGCSLFGDSFNLKCFLIQ